MEQDERRKNETTNQPTHPEDIPILADKPHPGPTGGVAGNHGNKENDDRVKWADRWMVRLTAAVAFFGLCAVAVSYLQWSAMQGQLAEMGRASDQNERMVILNTGQLRVAARSAKAAEEAALAAGRQTVISQDAFEASNRPYIAIKNVDFAGDETKKGIITHIIMKNFGSNPAAETEIDRHWFADGIETTHAPIAKKRGVFFPGVERPITDRFPLVSLKQLESGTIKLRTRVESTYHWGRQKYEYCEQFEYDPISKGFAMVNDCHEQH
jgi:hypothetical protein